MTIQEKLTRCAALIEKIKRGPVWCEGEGVRVRLRWKHDKRVAWWIKERYDSGRWRHYELMAGKPHDIACILEKWVRRELIEEGCNISSDSHETCIVLRNTGSHWIDHDYFTALIIAAEELLVAA